jgi:hypothetical protein
LLIRNKQTQLNKKQINPNLALSINNKQTLELYLGSTFGSCVGDGYRSTASAANTEATEETEYFF